MAGKATHPLTAADFQDAVVVAIGKLSEESSSAAIPFRSVITQTSALTGIAIDRFGLNEQVGKPWVVCWISWAFKALSDKGLGDKERKGWWGLTTLGKRAYEQLKTQNLSLLNKINKEDEDDEVAEPLSLVPPPVLPVLAPLVLGPLQTEEGKIYSAPSAGDYDTLDLYLQGLITAKTKCFGFYAPKSVVCGRCELRLTCYNAFFTGYQAFIEAYCPAESPAEEAGEAGEAGEVLSSVPLTPVVVPASKVSKVEKAPETVPVSKLGSPVGRTTKAAVDARCMKCGGAIPRDSSAVWFQGQGMSHPECVKSGSSKK